MQTFRVLLVDDEQGKLDVLRGNLAEMQCEICACTQPRQALAQARETKFDLVISDYRMPEMDGVTLIKTLKQTQPDLAAIILSGFMELRSVKNAIGDTIIYRILTKPWDVEKLQESVMLLMSRNEIHPHAPQHAAQPLAVRGAMAMLEQKYPGITLINTDWKSARE